MNWILDSKIMNDLQKESFEDFLAITKSGAKIIDIRVRKDGVEYLFQADFLKHMFPENMIWKIPAPEIREKYKIFGVYEVTNGLPLPRDDDYQGLTNH